MLSDVSEQVTWDRAHAQLKLIAQSSLHFTELQVYEGSLSVCFSPGKTCYRHQFKPSGKRIFSITEDEITTSI